MKPVAEKLRRTQEESTARRDMLLRRATAAGPGLSRFARFATPVSARSLSHGISGHRYGEHPERNDPPFDFTADNYGA